MTIAYFVLEIFGAQVQREVRKNCENSIKVYISRKKLNKEQHLRMR